MLKIMTLDEKLAISNKACALWEAGDYEGKTITIQNKFLSEKNPS
jgi:hypothetical protein